MTEAEQVKPMAGVTRLFRLGLGWYMIAYGIAAGVSPTERRSDLAIVAIPQSVHLDPRMFLVAFFAIPGMLILIRRTGTFGLRVAIAMFGIYDVGLVFDAVQRKGGWTGPVTFAFAAAACAGLNWVRKDRK